MWDKSGLRKIIRINSEKGPKTSRVDANDLIMLRSVSCASLNGADGVGTAARLMLCSLSSASTSLARVARVSSAAPGAHSSFELPNARQGALGKAAARQSTP